MAKKTSRARKVWIFKWLVKKHRCKPHLEKDFFFTSDRKKHEVFNIVLDREDGKSFKLMINVKPKLDGIRTLPTVVTIPAKYNISYADV